MTQPPLLPDLPAVTPATMTPTRPEVARVIRPVRNQVQWVERDLDSLVPEHHPTRVIWAFLEGLDLSRFYQEIRAVLDRPGHPATDPQVLLALWVYATVEGIGSARRLARLCEAHDGFRWLRGGVPINYHMLADFRVAHQAALDDLLTQIVAALLAEDLVTLQRVAQDGTRIRASAGAGSFHREDRLAACLQEARAQVAELAQQREQPDPGVRAREQQARERAARERAARVMKALEHLPALEAAKAQQVRSKAKAERVRVTAPRTSTTDPEARVMRMPDGGFRPAYNLQLATDTASQVIVGVTVTNQGTDAGQAAPMEQQVANRTGRHPSAYLMDGGFAARADITTLEQRGVTVYTPDRPPRTRTSGRAQGEPRYGDSPEVVTWRTRMQTADAKVVYRERAATAECVNAQVRGRYGLDQFTVRGLDKVLSVALLVAITHNLLRWLALTS